MLSSPIASETMLVLYISSGTSCGTWGKKQKTWTGLILPDYKLIKWLLCKPFQEHHKAEESRAVTNEKNPHPSLIKGLIFKP